MKLSSSKLIVILTISLGFALCAYIAWKKSAKLIPHLTQISADGNFRVEFYSVWTPTFIAFPGHGSDGIDGFIRLKHKDGRLIEEVFRTYLYGSGVSWNTDSVALLGDEYVDWKLPK